ncbi:MAG TPA: hypothetical protein VGL39_10535 [Jatrophihabitantaceae bacterium]|jgi:hypothetical protein
MMRAGRRLVVLGAVFAVAASVSACNVLKRADTTPSRLTTAAANAVEAPAAGDVGACPFAATDVEAILGGRWAVSNAPSGGCNYTADGRTILVSTVPLPQGAQARQAALARVRKPCDAASTQTLAGAGPGAFVCQQDTLVEAATISGDHLLVLCTAAGSDPAQVPGIQAQLGDLVSGASRAR